MLPASCRHCREPGVHDRLPDRRHPGAPASGDVEHQHNNCIGCENCARKCPYGKHHDAPPPRREGSAEPRGSRRRAIKCNLCRGYSYSNCVHECPARRALLRVDPLRYFEELALVMEGRAEGRDRVDAGARPRQAGLLGTKQQIRPRSTWFIPASFILGALMLAAVMVLAITSGGPAARRLRRGHPRSASTAALVPVSARAFLGSMRKAHEQHREEGRREEEDSRRRSSASASSRRGRSST